MSNDVIFAKVGSDIGGIDHSVQLVEIIKAIERK